MQRMSKRIKEIKILQENLDNANNGIIELKENIAEKDLHVWATKLPNVMGS